MAYLSCRSLEAQAHPEKPRHHSVQPDDSVLAVHLHSECPRPLWELWLCGRETCFYCIHPFQCCQRAPQRGENWLDFLIWQRTSHISCVFLKTYHNPARYWGAVPMMLSEWRYAQDFSFRKPIAWHHFKINKRSTLCRLLASWWTSSVAYLSSKQVRKSTAYIAF